jgi:hypothetical protein
VGGVGAKAGSSGGGGGSSKGDDPDSSRSEALPGLFVLDVQYHV